MKNKLASILITQVIFSILITGSCYFSNAKQYTFEVAIGSLFIFVSLLLFGWIYIAFTDKKLVALGVSLIVIKFSLLIGSLYLLLNSPGLNVLWVAAGVGTLVPTIIVVGLIQTFLKGPEN